MKKVLIMQGMGPNMDMIEECQRRNIEPIIFFQHTDIPFELEKVQKTFISTYPKYVKVLEEQTTYKKTLSMLKKEKIDCICNMSEPTVSMASKLSTDLKIPGLSYKYINYYIYKDGMQEALKKYGIRYIRSEVARTVDDAIQLFKKFGSKPVVLKPLRGAGTVAIKFCYTLDDVIKASKEILSERSMLGSGFNTEFAVQEFILGEEYIVNTSVVNGKTRINGICKYKLVDVGGRPIYNNTEFVDPNSLIDLGMTDLIDYVFEVNKAMHFDNGFIHSEFYLNDDGPILIEVNCRIMGGPFTSNFLSDTIRFSDSQTVLNNSLFPNNQNKLLNYQYTLYKKSILSFILNFTKKEIFVKSIPLIPLIKRLKSYHHHFIEFQNNTIKPTIDFETLVSKIYFQHEDPQLVVNEDEFIRTLNKRYFWMLIEAQDEPNTKIEKSKGISPEQYINDVKEMGTVLYLNDTNKKIPLIKTTSLEKIDKELKDYQFGVINFTKKPKYNREQLVEKMFVFLDKIATGGEIFISNQCYQIFPYGTIGFEIILKIAGFKVEIPRDDYRGLFAKKMF